MFLNTWFASNLLLTALVIQLARRSVYADIPLFTACVAFRLIQALAISVAMGRVQFLSYAYLLTWFVTESIALVLVALSSAECYLWLTRRIHHLGLVGVGAVAAAVLTGAVAMMGTRLDSAEDLSRGIALQLLFKQSLMAFLAVSLAVLVGFYRRFPLHVPRQAWPHVLTQLAYLAAHSLGYGTIAVEGSASTANMNELLSIAWIACLVAWLWIFRNGVTWPDAPPDAGDGDRLQRADEQAERLERLL